MMRTTKRRFLNFHSVALGFFRNLHCIILIFYCFILGLLCRLVLTEASHFVKFVTSSEMNRNDQVRADYSRNW